MNWPDEHYVKLYTRDSLTWKSWKWETRTTFLHLIRKVDGSGFIETGRMDPVDALSLQLELPRVVVAPGFEQLVVDETCEATDRAVLLVNYVSAQEARKTEGQKKRDYRERTIVRRRTHQLAEFTQPHVPSLAPTGTAMDPSSSALLVPVLLKPAGKKPPGVRIRKPKDISATGLALADVEVAQAPAEIAAATNRAAEPDRRHAPLVKALAEIFEAERGSPLAFDGRQARAVAQLLTRAEPAEIETRYRRALRRRGFPTVATPAELLRNWDHFATELPVKIHIGPIDAATQTHAQTGWVENF